MDRYWSIMHLLNEDLEGCPHWQNKTNDVSQLCVYWTRISRIYRIDKAKA